MKRPKLSTFIFGHPLVAMGLILATGYMLYHWWTQTDTSSSVQPILAGWIVWMIFTSVSQVADYKSWERRWVALGGGDPDAVGGHFGFRRMRTALALLVWAGWAYWLYESRYLHGTSDYDRLITAWAAVTLVICLYWLFRFIRWANIRSSQARAIKAELKAQAFVVKGTLLKAQTSPSIRDSAISLPDNLRALIKRLPRDVM